MPFLISSTSRNPSFSSSIEFALFSSAMATAKLLLAFCALICLFVPSLALSSPSANQSCSSFIFSDHNKVFASCTDLPVLNSFFHWTYNPSTKALQIAYRHSGITSSSKWVAWGINPASKAMVGTQAIVAYQKPDGTMSVYTSPLDSYGTQLPQGNLSFPVSDLSATFLDNEIIVFATIELPNNTNTSTLNHVWQDGPVSNDNNLGVHDVSGLHLQSMGTLNLESGIALASHGDGGNSRTKLKIIHGVLNAISWGLMMPLGFISARYLKAAGATADPLWFYLHICLQFPAYLIGMVGGATGLLLITKSSGIHYPCHMGIGITLFCLGLLQVSALFFRPAKDHKFRYIWNWFHHITGYTVLLLSFANIWLGFSILKPGKAWIIAYRLIFGTLILSTALLEVWKHLPREGGHQVNKSTTSPENNV